MTDNGPKRNLKEMKKLEQPFGDTRELGLDGVTPPVDRARGGKARAASLGDSMAWLKQELVRIAGIDIRMDQQRWRPIAIAFAVVLNSLFVWTVASALKPPGDASAEEIHLVLSPFAHVEVASLPAAPEPTLPVVEMPQVVIQTETSAPAAASASIVLAPRPDPVHPNPLPGADDIGSAAAVVIVLKIMVLPDGTVDDAVVVKSSGRHDTDLAAIAFVKAQWRFLPALMGGIAIQYWTTVSLRTV
jgi:TonB family protein